MAKLSANGTELVRTKQVNGENVLITSYRSNGAILYKAQRIRDKKILWKGTWSHRKDQNGNRLKFDPSKFKSIDIFHKMSELDGVQVLMHNGIKIS